MELSPNSWEKAIGADRYTVRYLSDIYEHVIPALRLKGEFPAQTFRRLLLEGKFSQGDLMDLNNFGRKNLKSLLEILGLVLRDEEGFASNID